MADVSVNSVQTSEVSNEMVAYLLAASILGGGQHSKSFMTCAGLPIIAGYSEKEILQTYAKCLMVVKAPYNADEVV